VSDVKLHDSICALAGKAYSRICPLCERLTRARADERERIADLITAQIKSPTLQTQRVLRLIANPTA
jgi:hypothetical protein